MTIPARVALLVLLLSAVGCPERVFLNTAPSDAQVIVDGRPVGTTPLTVSVPRTKVRDRLPVRFEREGYEPLETELRAHVTAGRMFGYVFTSGILAAFKGPFSFERIAQPFVMAPLSAQERHAEALGPNGALAEQLDRLDRMHKAGTITDGEYRQLRESTLRREIAK